MVTLSDIHAAAARLAPYVTTTPLLESDAVNDRVGGRLLVKAESLQKTGSFKIRGATNCLLRLSDTEKAAGVVAYSSGNHAQGVALAARWTGVAATIVMPADAPAAKIDGTRGFGAEVVLYDRALESREEIAAGIARRSGAVIVPPFDHPDIIAGQGTVGLEIAAQCSAIETIPDEVVICCSGGGLSAGCAISLSGESAMTRVTIAEPAGFDDTGRSLATGTRQYVEGASPSICDALLLPTPGELTLPILADHGVTGVAVSDEQVRAAMRVAFEDFRLVLEPGGAAALAASLSGAVEVAGRTIVVVATGGNVDRDLFVSALK